VSNFLRFFFGIISGGDYYCVKDLNASLAGGGDPYILAILVDG
jgi:hypothetical protein